MVIENEFIEAMKIIAQQGGTPDMVIIPEDTFIALLIKEMDYTTAEAAAYVASLPIEEQPII